MASSAVQSSFTKGSPLPSSPGNPLSSASNFSSSASAKKKPLPPIEGSGASKDGGTNIMKNPFVMPPETEVFLLREKERTEAKKEKDHQKQLHVHEKTTHASRMNALTAGRRKEIVSPNLPAEVTAKDTSHLDDAEFVLATTRDRQIEKEDLAKYVSNKREMFLVQYSLGVKREEIRKLEQIAKAEEKKLQEAEKSLEESASLFDEFLKENDKNSVEAIKMAESATKRKLEKVSEIKRLNAQIMAIKSELSRNEEQLHELRTYRQFLNAVTPLEWMQERTAKAEAKPPAKVLLDVSDSSDDLEEDGTQRLAEELAQSESDQEEEEVELYFHDPKQLMEIFTELEEQNLSLIQNSQETEEALEEVKQNKQLAQLKMNRETEGLSRQIQSLQSAIAVVEERASDLKMKSQLFSFGQYNAGDQETMLQTLHQKVSDVYIRCIGGNEATISTLQMLTSIENRLEELFETVESLPPDKVETAEKAKEKERRLRMREDKLEQQKVYQEERMRRALERAQADPKKRGGRKLVYRSEPPVLKRKAKDAADKKSKEEEELQYFFS